MQLRRTLLWAWATVLLALLLWPLAAPGELLLRDMAVVDSPALSLNAFGFGDLPARNAPQDGVLALFGFLPVSWLVRVILLASGLAGAYGAMRLGPAQFAAVTITIYNPFVVERLLQGHWSLVMAAWLLPLIAALREHPRWQIVAMWAGSLTPTGAVVATVVGVVASRSRVRTACLGVVTWLPWLVPALLSTPTSGGATAFVVRAEAHASTPGTMLGLGGIWNADAVPASRESGFALFGIALFAVLITGFRNCPRPVLILGTCGLLACAGSWLLPGVFSWVVSTVPGAGLFRDSQKLLMFAIPAYAAMAGGLSRPPVEELAVALALVQMPDAPREVAVLRPEYSDTAELANLARGRDVLLVDAPPLVARSDGLPVVDPRSKALSLVESGELRVDGEITDSRSQRHVEASRAWGDGDLNELRELGVGVVVDGGTVTETGAGPRRGWRFHLGIALSLMWLVFPLVFPLVAALRRRPTLPTSGAGPAG
ncbi:hypothetical protein [Corynebacterium pacaense]|uniref:hypothetical protein n=1 Tax=Corynebacterium pacaense TaxID=1816684 RepID=UPI0009BAB262|nr:hypothetical protein [Corynebacterium pacaense]